MGFNMGWVAIALLLMFVGMFVMGEGGRGMQDGFHKGMSNVGND